MMDDCTTDFAVGLSTHAELGEAVTEVCAKIQETKTTPPDLTIVFVTHHHADAWDQLAKWIHDRLSSQCLLGCSGESIVGTGIEVEDSPGLVVWCAWLPNSELTPFRIQFENTSEGGAIVGWPDALAGDWPDQAVVLMLAEPFSFPADYLLERINEDRVGVAVLGGIASGAASPGENRLFFGAEYVSDGAVGVVFDKSVSVTSVVSQGCRPIGDPMVITKAERNVIYELGGNSAWDQLQTLFNRLPTQEQLLVQNGLHIGRVVTEYQDRFEPGDFLIRNVLALDRETGSMTVADFVRAGQTIQFQVRDELTAHQDLEVLLKRKHKSFSAQAALLFTCNGRGSRMFSDPNHDAKTIANELGAIPLAGFFAQGEMGPVAGKTYLHGFTASLALFR